MCLYERDFNSIMVRLKAHNLQVHILLVDHFNSIMVRLKAGILSGTMGGLQQFQFHYGTIKCDPAVQVYSSLIAVSIPVWYD